MNLIQVILYLALLICFLAYIRLVRSAIIDRLVCLALFLIAGVSVMFPDATTTVARFVGVGRGADLMLYTFSMVGLFVLVLLYSKIERLSQANTQIIRAEALKSARKPIV
jgi:hypothetical protein